MNAILIGLIVLGGMRASEGVWKPRPFPRMLELHSKNGHFDREYPDIAMRIETSRLAMLEHFAERRADYQQYIESYEKLVRNDDSPAHKEFYQRIIEQTRKQLR